MSHDKAKRRQSTTVRLSHNEVGDLLHAYAHETLIGGSPEARYPAVAAHLARCARCRADLAEVLEVTRVAFDPAGAPALACTPPDLSRLTRPWQQQTVAERPWFIDRFERIWLEFSQPLLRTWQPSPLLGSARGALLFAYRQEAASNDPSLRVEVYAEDDPATTLVSVTVDVPGRNALDQSGMPVTVYVGDSVRQAETDKSGTARFPQIPRQALQSLRLAITLGRSA
jgi:hypothetical protein